MTSRQLTGKEKFSVIYIIENMKENDKFDETAEKVLMAAPYEVHSLIYETLSDALKNAIVKKFPDVDVTVPSFVVLHFDIATLKRAVKEMEKKHKWKKLFGRIDDNKYFQVEHDVLFSYENIVHYSDNADDAISYILEHVEAYIEEQ
ncbi:hypothetical protein [Oceanobacillus kapialis]|uniref:Uncharacterized protein n=1 Tax=Oceanobacillus kapialis TaxID=481353 RepID=A0ABW5PVQ3_9BACI